MSQRENEFVGSIYSHDGTLVHYKVIGKEPTAVVFVHGWCCNHTFWDKQLRYFSKEYTVATLDLGGHGKSGLGRSSWTMDAFGEDVVAVIKELDLQEIVLIGHSMGGPVILEAACQMPERVAGVVGADTFHNVGKVLSNQEAAEKVSHAKREHKKALNEAARAMFLPTSNPFLVETVVDQMMATDPEIALDAIHSLFIYDYRRSLRKLKIPKIAINSDQYNATNIEAANEYGIKVILMPAVGHFVMMEDSDTFNNLLHEEVQQIFS